MSIFIFPLFVISAVGLMVQSAPVKREKKSIEDTLSLCRYCTADALHRNVQLFKQNFSIGLHTNHTNITNTQTLIMDEIYNQFSKECKDFYHCHNFKASVTRLFM